MKRSQDSPSDRLHVGICLGFIILAGLAVGWPTLDAGYLSGDDEQLIYNHALVNHPSWSHALKLFHIVHRDLYQPIPLLSFQVEFAIHGGQVKLLHLTNVFIHALNGVLVWWLFRRLSRNGYVPLLMGLMFVVHPLAVEGFAWLNGRMIMLSTTFSLCSLIAFDSWRRGLAGIRPHPSTNGEKTLCIESPRGLKPAARSFLCAALVLLFVVLAMMSKVRVGLPFLLLLFPLSQRFRPTRQWWGMWSIIVVVTAAFVLLNVSATAESGLFEGGQRYLAGPPPARAVLALGWYVRHYAWPTGLAPWYAPPKIVSWGDPQVLIALAIFAVFVGLILLSLRWSRVGLLGFLWFMVTIASTLPFLPARNLLVADRYAYLPVIGLHWLIATAFLHAAGKISQSARRKGAVVASGLAATALLAAWTGVSREVTDYYHDNLAKIRRMIERSPNHPRLLSSLGWRYYEQGDYVKAMELANEELNRFGDDDVAFCKAMKLRASSQYALNGDFKAAEQDLLEAVQRDARFVKGYYRLGLICRQEGQSGQAIKYLEKAVEIEPRFNPALKLLGGLYRKAGQLDQAKKMYESAIINSRRYDVKAINAAGEIEIQQGLYERAIERYRKLLAWYEEGVVARINLAIALSVQGRDQEAIEEYHTVLRWDHTSCEARLNLAALLIRQGRDQEAWEQYRSLLGLYPQDRRVLVSASDFLRGRRRYGLAAGLWLTAVKAEPRATDILAWHSLHLWYVKDIGAARKAAVQSLQIDPDMPTAHLTLVLAALAENQPELVAQHLETFLGLDLSDSPEMFEYAFEGLEFYSTVDSESPWPYYVTTRLLLAQDRLEVAQRAQRAFEDRCKEAAWHMRLQAIVEQAQQDRKADAIRAPTSDLESP